MSGTVDYNVANVVGATSSEGFLQVPLLVGKASSKNIGPTVTTLTSTKFIKNYQKILYF